MIDLWALMDSIMLIAGIIWFIVAVVVFVMDLAGPRTYGTFHPWWQIAMLTLIAAFMLALVGHPGWPLTK